MNISPDIPRIFTALAEWAACLVCIGCSPRRFKGLKLWTILGTALVVESVFLELTGPLPLGWWMPCMIVAIALMLFLIWLCCDISFLVTVYFTARAFLLAELAASLEWQLYSYWAGQIHALAGWVGAIFNMCLIYALIFSFIYWWDTRRKGTQAAMTYHFKDIWPSILVVLVAFFMGNLSFVYNETPFSGTTIFDIHHVRTLSDLAGFVLLYALHLRRSELYAEQEINAIHGILQSQYAQYRNSQESIDLINRKYHDLKHQIAYLRAEQDPGRRSAFLDSMEDEIKVYEAQNKTGNSILDTVLTSKSLYCSSHSIEFTCVADGTLLSFMDVMDICTIFGNLLDNAIECELRIFDTKKRIIRLFVRAFKGFVSIQCENFCEESPAFQDGLPLTTKSDTGIHGYGVKSVRYSVEKYGGTMTIRNEDHWFTVNLLIPLRTIS